LMLMAADHPKGKSRQSIQNKSFELVLVLQSIDFKWFTQVLVSGSNWSWCEGAFFRSCFKYSWLDITLLQTEVLDWRGFCALRA
jgi:hypothetical protein